MRSRKNSSVKKGESREGAGKISRFFKSRPLFVGEGKVCLPLKLYVHLKYMEDILYNFAVFRIGSSMRSSEKF